MDKTNSIMVLGKPNSGKTVYSAQLYGRLTRGIEQQITIRNTPENLDIFQEALERLAEGNNPQRTTSSQFANVSLPLLIKNEKEVDLTWFDYAGEQLTHIFESRSVNEKWAETLINANGWMVFIRLNDENKYKYKIEDLLKNRDVIKKDTKKKEVPDAVDANVWWIELFQIILHVCNLKRSQRVLKPKIAIILSCYDQVSNSTSTIPKEIFEKELPLLNQFLHSNWEKDKISIWGLSSLGTVLDGSSQNTFVDNGPENQGWIIAPDNHEKNADLTSPIVWIYG
ncbi:hypothetical protein QDT13_003427 [Acinetobacter baumannii]|nr:hypothetical protein [Acinetobacter baumannii]EKV3807503.1 hypothetical protein [Acinetobacter baumannii]EKW1173716.1 hypothetical protein [Acinetobacter baumannii]MCT6572670.1 hypothetical protein [Acinetobacter baumannii]MCT6575711.1 hypothetical protein [Acinetobacter baumannii]MCT6598708.1 hypothetical protein [Acinetobacter baumannii]